MKLESKLGISTGVLILAMLVSALFAHIRIQEANRLADLIFNGRVPIISLTRDVRVPPMMSVRSLETYLLFGADDPKASARFRKERRTTGSQRRSLARQTPRTSSRTTISAGCREFQQFDARPRPAPPLEEEAERLNELHTPAGASQARALLQHRFSLSMPPCSPP